MKVRKGFVTNSSSSSFILAFENKKELDGFYDYCFEFDYESFYDYVKNWIKKPNHQEKEEIVKNLKHWYEYEVCDKRSILDKYVKQADFEDYREYIKARNEVENSENFKKEMHAALQKTDFYKKRKRVFRAEYIVDQTIWDTSGGLMEWAIRHGFIEREMYKYNIYVLHVG